jgi:hypothetical protein
MLKFTKKKKERLFLTPRKVEKNQRTSGNEKYNCLD